MVVKALLCSSVIFVYVWQHTQNLRLRSHCRMVTRKSCIVTKPILIITTPHFFDADITVCLETLTSSNVMKASLFFVFSIISHVYHDKLNHVYTKHSIGIHTLTYLLTPCSKVLLEKLTGLQPVKKLPAFYGTRRFITAVTNALHLSLS